MRRAFARWAIARFERAVDLNLENIERALRDASPVGRLLDLGCDDGELTTRFADAARAGEIHCVELAQHRRARDGLAAGSGT